MGRIEPGQVGYIEAHGTGTSLGDPMELRALGNVLGEGRPADRPVLVGSVKTNFGHLEAAAGVAGLIKAVLALQHDVIPPHLHFETPNPYVPWSELPISIVTKPTAWPASAPSKIAGTQRVRLQRHQCARGAGGSAETDGASSGRRSGRSTSSRCRREAGRRSPRWPGAGRPRSRTGPTRSADICFTANAGRAQFMHRAAFAASNAAELRERLGAIASGDDRQDVLRGKASPEPPRVAFLFTGQGSQFVGMARQLYETLPAFRQAPSIGATRSSPA